MEKLKLDLVIIGDTGAGKTHFCYTAKNAYIIETDPKGMHTIIQQSGYMPNSEEFQKGEWKLPNGGYFVQAGSLDPAESIRVIEKHLRLFQKNQIPKHMKFVLDGASFANKLWVLESNPSRNKDDGLPTLEAPGKLRWVDWGEVRTRNMLLLFEIAYLDYDTIVTVLPDLREDALNPGRDKEGNIINSRIYPLVDTRARFDFGAHFANVGLLENSGIRVLWFQHPKALVKCSNSEVRKVEEPNYTKVMKSIYGHLYQAKKVILQKEEEEANANQTTG